MKTETKNIPEPLHDFSFDVQRIPKNGFHGETSANEDQLRALSAALELLSFDALRVRYSITEMSHGGYKLHVRYNASYQQQCVVTLEPIKQTLEEVIDEEFRETATAPAGSEENEIEISSHYVPEVLNDGVIELGRVLFEDISSAIDPHPRKDGSGLDWQDPQSDGDASASDHPFAVLAKLTKGKE